MAIRKGSRSLTDLRGLCQQGPSFHPISSNTMVAAVMSEEFGQLRRSVVGTLDERKQQICRYERIGQTYRRICVNVEQTASDWRHSAICQDWEKCPLSRSR